MDRIQLLADHRQGRNSCYRGGGRGWKRKKRHKLHLRLSQRNGLPWGNPTVPAQTANRHTRLHCDTNSGEQNKVCHQHMRSYIHTIYETKHAHVCIITFMSGSRQPWHQQQLLQKLAVTVQSMDTMWRTWAQAQSPSRLAPDDVSIWSVSVTLK